MTHEQAYWADMAALLDPDCYSFVDGTNWTVTVPPGKTWYLLNGWALRKDGAPYNNYKWHHRDLDAREAMQLPAGFKLHADDQGLAYYADPSIVQAGDARYTDDPKGLYYERLARLKDMPLHILGVHRPLGTAWNAADPTTKAALPPEHSKILVRHIDCHDGCWVIMHHTSHGNQMNTQDEVDDVRSIRLTRTVLAPIRSDLHNAIWLGHGNAQSNPQGTQTHNGWGSIHYNVLPSDW